MVVAVQQRGSVPQAGAGDSLRILSRVLLPTLAKGVIIRRRKMVGLAERWDLDRRGVRELQRLHERYGRGPVLLNLLGRRQAIILDGEDVRRVLQQTPEPFASASMEKRAALSHFEPMGALVSHGPERQERRRFNEEALQSDDPMHRLAGSFVDVVEREATEMLGEAARGGGGSAGVLDWPRFEQAWFRIVRQVIFGAAARDDEKLHEQIDALRARGNWAFLAPTRKKLREQFLARVREYLRRAEPGSLAEAAAGVHASEVTAPEHQAPQWLFAFDPGGMTTFRSLALLASHAQHAARAREELAAQGRVVRHEPLPYLRAIVLESLRLWPTTPLVLRQTTRETEWETGVLPAETGVVIYAPYFHRDDTRLEFADRLTPDLWLESAGLGPGKPVTSMPNDWPLIPFSGGSGVCPGRNVVLLVSTAMLATVLRQRQLRLEDHARLDPQRPLPGTLDPYTLRIELH